MYLSVYLFHAQIFLLLLKKVNEIGKYTGSNYTIELKEDAKPYHINPFPLLPLLPLPKNNRLTFKKEVDGLIKIGVIKKIFSS